MNIQNIKTLISKEFKNHFDHITGYLLISIVLGLAYLIFLKAFFLNGIATMRDLFVFIYWPLSFFVPAVTMGSIAQEKEKHTIEYLLTKPITYTEILISKILSSTFFAYLPILLTLPLAFFIKRIGNLDLGETLGAYVGAFILVLAMASVGVMVSSFFKNQISALLTTAVLIFLLNLIGTEFFSLNLPNFIAVIFSQFSIYDNYTSLTRGVYNVSNVFYFVIIVTITFGIAYINLAKIRVSNASKYLKNTTMTIVTMIFVGLALYATSKLIKGRLDFTSSQKYTLSNVTKDLIKSDGVAKIDVYYSQNLEPRFQTNLGELKNMLEDFKFYGGNNVQVQYFDAAEHKDALDKLGIQPIQQQVTTNDQASVALVYFAVVISDKDNAKQEKIPFVQDISNIEYDMANLINKIKQKDKPRIAMYSNSQEYTALSEFLADGFNLQNIEIPLKVTSTAPVKTKATEPDFNLDGIQTLLLVAPKTEFTDNAKKKIIDYFNNGGKIIYLVDTMTKAPDLSTITKVDAPVGSLFKDLGIEVRQDVVYDTKSNIKINIPSGGPVPAIVSYPPFVLTFKDNNQNLGNIPENIIMPLSASLDLKDDSWKVVYATTKDGNTQQEPDIKPGRQFSSTNSKVVPVVALKTNDKGGKLLVSGTSMIFENQIVQNSQNNAILANSTFEILTSSINLTAIKAKNVLENRVQKIDEFDKATVNYFAPLISFGILIGIGIWRILRRKMIRARFAR